MLKRSMPSLAIAVGVTMGVSLQASTAKADINIVLTLPDDAAPWLDYAKPWLDYAQDLYGHDHGQKNKQKTKNKIKNKNKNQNGAGGQVHELEGKDVQFLY